MVEELKIKKRLLKAVKIAVGSSAAIFLAKMLHLEYEISAGTIALLTIVTTKWETVKLSLFRVATLVITIILARVLFWNISNEWAAYGLFVFILVMISEMLGWGATISVNSVIGAHILTKMDFSGRFILNEVMLVVIGITIAVIANLFYDYETSRKKLVTSMRLTENRLQMLLGEMAAYLSNKEMQRNVWEDIRELEAQLKQFIAEAHEYQDNTFCSHPGYYIDYFEMRMRQCNTLHNLHYEVKKIRNMPAQAKIVADYVLYMMDYVVEKNTPDPQLARLQQIFDDMKREPLPKSREEFESRAILYHILMDLEDFLVYKRRFVEGLNEKQRMIYWNKDS